jgi:CIC family chloride channel protein
MQIKEIGEEGIIKAIKNINQAEASQVLIGIGDDAAVVRPEAGMLCLYACHMLVENSHFLLSKSTPFQIGYKGVSKSVADIEAMGATSRFLLVGISMSPDTPAQFIRELYEGILSNDLSWYLVVILMGAKLIATSLTLGSGGLGGVFAPSLYMGSMLGGSYGYLLNQLFPSMTALPGAYALVGMAGVFAGIAQAPITAIIIIFEMTGDYKVVLPLMLVCVISALVARGICPESIYTLKLVREGRDPYKGEKIDKMGQTLVQSVMTSEVETLDINYSLKTAREIMQQRSHTGFPVMSDGRLLGLVTYEQVLSALKRDENSCLREIIKPDLIYVHPQDTIAVVVEKMAEGDVGRLPVVDPEDPGILLGIVSRSDIIEAYSMAAQR